jgi:hypothetical protein
MKDRGFDKKFQSLLFPKLEELGFTQVSLKDCMHPEYLFKNGRLWFELSWDWRDRYLDVALGHLHWFKDVMPRVVVIGDYSSYKREITFKAIDTIGSESKVMEIIANSLEQSILIYREHYTDIFEGFRKSRAISRGINIDDYIGKEVTSNELIKFEA